MNRIPSYLCYIALLFVLQTSILRAEDPKPAEVNITGVWKAKVEVAGQTGEPTFTLTQDGDKITGEYSGSFGKEEVTGKITGDKFSFEFEVDQGTITYSGVIDGDSIKGEAKYADLPGTWTAKRDGADSKVEAVLVRYLHAIGGQEAWSKVETRQMKADLNAAGATTEWTLVAKSPNLRATRVELPGLGLIQDGFDGKTAWQKSINGIKTKEGEELARAKIEADFRREVRLKELYPDLEFKGTEKFNDNTVQVLESKPSATSKERFSFSDQTGLLVRQQSTVNADDGNELGVETELSDYRDVDGMKYPHVQKLKILAGSLPLFEFELRVKDIKHNEKIDDAVFAKPAN